MGSQNWQLFKQINRHMKMETPITSPGCQTKRGNRMKVNIGRSLKTHAFSLLPIPSLTSQLPSFLNTTSSISPKCMHLFPSLWQYCRPPIFTGYSLLTGLPATIIVILWNQKTGLVCAFSTTIFVEKYLALHKCLVNTVGWMYAFSLL